MMKKSQWVRIALPTGYYSMVKPYRCCILSKSSFARVVYSDFIIDCLVCMDNMGQYRIDGEYNYNFQQLHREIHKFSS